MGDFNLGQAVSDRIQNVKKRRQAAIDARKAQNKVAVFSPYPIYLCYLKNPEDEEDFLEMQYPPKLKETKTVNWDSVDIRGLSDPIFQHRSGGERAIPISFDLKQHCDSEQDPNIIEQAWGWLNSKSVANIEDGKYKAPPPSVILEIGRYVRFIRWKSVSIEVSKRFPSQRPRRATITIQAFAVIQGHENPSFLRSRF